MFPPWLSEVTSTASTRGRCAKITGDRRRLHRPSSSRARLDEPDPEPGAVRRSPRESSSGEWAPLGEELRRSLIALRSPTAARSAAICPAPARAPPDAHRAPRPRVRSSADAPVPGLPPSAPPWSPDACPSMRPARSRCRCPSCVSAPVEPCRRRRHGLRSPDRAGGRFAGPRLRAASGRLRSSRPGRSRLAAAASAGRRRPAPAAVADAAVLGRRRGRCGRRAPPRRLPPSPRQQRRGHAHLERRHPPRRRRPRRRPPRPRAPAGRAAVSAPWSISIRSSGSGIIIPTPSRSAMPRPVDRLAGARRR